MKITKGLDYELMNLELYSLWINDKKITMNSDYPKCNTSKNQKQKKSANQCKIQINWRKFLIKYIMVEGLRDFEYKELKQMHKKNCKMLTDNLKTSI